MSIVDTGGTFLGCLREKNGYFNFFPIALFVAAGLHILTRDELNTLFYDSSQKGRNLWFPYQREEFDSQHCSRKCLDYQKRPEPDQLSIEAAVC